MLTFVRTNELINATWNEIDLEEAEWVIPAERMKMRRAHVVPLSRQAVSILQEQKEAAGNREFVFPSMTRPKKPMSNNTILYGPKRLGYGGNMTGHGFRALAMTTIKEKLNIRTTLLTANWHTIRVTKYTEPMTALNTWTSVRK